MMNRRRFLQAAGVGAAATAAGGLRRPVAGGEGGGKAGGGKAGRPNILFVLTDDQRNDMLGCAGHAILKTPEMDRLAAEGVRFANAFVTTPICAASRATFLTGLYERRHGYTFRTPPIGEADWAMSYPVLLRRAGYRTGFVGKFGVGVAGGRKAIGKAFDEFARMGRHPYFKKRDGGKRHLTDLTADRAIEFLDGCEGGTPFCLSVSFNAPHAEDSDKRQYIWPPSADGLYEDVTIPPAPMSEPKWFQAQPEFVRKGLNRTRWHWRFDTPEKYQRMVKGYYRMITGVDRAIGRIRKALAERGLAENTVIVLAGDNGYFLGERGFAGKWLMYEPSLRVPLIVCDPRAAKADRGVVRTETALNLDCSPTFLDLAGVTRPGGVQGRSLRPLLGKADAPADWNEEFLCEHLFKHKGIPQSEGVRTPKWKYFRYRHHRGVEELYDLAADPMEKVNLAGKPEHQATLGRFRKRCDALIERHGKA